MPVVTILGPSGLTRKAKKETSPNKIRRNSFKSEQLGD